MSACNSGDLKLDAAVNSWLKHDKNPKTRQEVLDDIAASKWDKLRSTMLSRQKFGTAGLRGRMAAGYKCINDVVVLQTAQGLCSYLSKVCSQSQLHSGIVVGYDGRYNSKRFAELTAKVFINTSIPVRIFSDVTPTPLVSFATIRYGAAAGVMVTASHNPKEDNGYKVYWGNGTQIISPHDDHVLEEVMLCLDIPEDNWNIDEIRGHPLVTDCLDDVTTAYLSYIKDSVHPDAADTNKAAGIPTVYSAMHGVGYHYVLKAFDAVNLKEPLSVKEQQDPNPEFPTVKFPNPEEPECLLLSQQLAERNGVKLVLVNDPDADRLAVSEFDDRTKSWKVFTGNEMGSLLGWWLLDQYQKKYPTIDDADEVYVMASIVSSRMLAAIVKDKGHFVETLTGFKWMGNTTLLLQQQGKRALFAFEEAIGYMCDPRVPDKDGVSAAVQVATLASHLYSKGSSLQRQLFALYKQHGYHVSHNSYYICHEQVATLASHLYSKGSSLQRQLFALYKQYGYHVSHNSYYICHEQATINKIFRRIRNYHGPGEYPKHVGSCDIQYIKDFTAGVKIPEHDGEEVHLKVIGTGLDQDYTSGEMIMFRASNGLSVTVRTSGTEPKIKYYTELVCKADDEAEQEDMKIKLKDVVQEFINELIQPKENGLI